MVIVHGPYRRRGLATRLMERSIAELRDRGLVPFLDATPAGRPVYERMGFRAVEAPDALARPGRRSRAHDTPPLVDVAEIAELDRAAFGADRSAVLADLLARKGAVSRRDPAATASSWHARAAPPRYVGPVVARETRYGAATARVGAGRDLRPGADRRARPPGGGHGPARRAAASSPSGPSRGWRSTTTRVSAIPRWFAPSRHRSSG